LLATANFNNETASGWQETPLPSPVPIAANTQYMTSYSEHGGFVYTLHGFDVGVDAPPLHVPAQGGVYQRPEGTFLTWFGTTRTSGSMSWSSIDRRPDDFKMKLLSPDVSWRFTSSNIALIG
jgi:hypothetical protein